MLEQVAVRQLLQDNLEKLGCIEDLGDCSGGAVFTLDQDLVADGWWCRNLGVVKCAESRILLGSDVAVRVENGTEVENRLGLFCRRGCRVFACHRQVLSVILSETIRSSIAEPGAFLHGGCAVSVSSPVVSAMVLLSS